MESGKRIAKALRRLLGRAYASKMTARSGRLSRIQKASWEPSQLASFCTCVDEHDNAEA